MAARKRFARREDLGLTKGEFAVLRRLNTPRKIQAFLFGLKQNFEPNGDTRERLLELIGIESNSVVRKDLGACTDKYREDWTPILEGSFARVSYGHDIENVWLIAEACEAAELPISPLLDLFRTLWRTSLEYGYDRAGGGFYDSGRFREAADIWTKVWWVQAEAIVSALTMYRLTGEPTYLEVFDKTLGYIERSLVDWENGEWHEFVTPEGKTGGSKAHAWKANYHDGRALVKFIETFGRTP